MRTFIVLACALVLVAFPMFFTYLDAEALLGCSDSVGRWLEPWLLGPMIVATILIPIALPWIVGLFGEEDPRF